MVYFPQNAIKIFPETVAQRMEGLGRPVTAQDKLEKEIAIETLPSKYHSSEYDKGPYLRDETWMQFVKWRMTGEESQAIEYVPANVSVGVMIPTKGVYNPGNIAGVTLPYSLIDLNIRDVGKYISLQHNFRQDLMDYIRSDEGYRLSEWLNGLGYGAEDIEYIAVGFVPEQAIYAIGRLCNGKIAIYANKNSYRINEREAEAFDMDIKEKIEKGIGEELIHNFRRSYDKRFGRIGEEKATKAIEKEFYEGLLERTFDSKLKAKYSGIIRNLEVDIGSVARYAGLYSRDLSELEAILEKEAEGRGVSKEERGKYISARLEEIAKAAKNEYLESDVVGDIDAEMSNDAEAYEDGEAEAAEACAEAAGDGGE